MKRRIDASALAANVPPPTQTFYADTMAQLGAMAAQEEKPMKKKLMTTILVAALLLALLCATALAAVTLRRSMEADVVARARGALAEAYGLSVETLGLFRADIRMAEDTTVVAFTAEIGYQEQAGIYEVVLPAEGAPQASWSHDDKDPALWQDGDLDAPVWGQPQLMRKLEKTGEDRMYYSSVDWVNMDLAERARVQPVTLEFNAAGALREYGNAVPGEADMGEAEALALANDALMERYGIDMARFDEGFEREVQFLEDTEDGTREYRVRYRVFGDIWEDAAVWFTSPEGEITHIHWDVAPERRTLPEGPLDDYGTAVGKFMSEGSMVYRQAAEKAEIAQRLAAADMAFYIQPALPYAMPTADDLPEQEALAMAAAAMKDELGLDADALALFEAYTSLLDGGEGRKWMVSYRVISQLDPIWDQIKEKLGGYDVVMDAATGAVEEITWDLAAEWVEADYTVRDWATAPVYHSKLVPWLAALKAETDAIVAKYPDLTAIYDYTPEDAAAHDTAFREAGFPAEHFSYALPAKDDVQAEEAIRLARQALLEEGVATAEALDGAGLVVTYSIAGENGPCWYLSFFVQGEIEIDYGVTLDARDGNILRTAISTGGNG